MSTVLVDTNIVSYLYKQDTRGILYEPHRLGQEAAISLMTVAELLQWAAFREWIAATALQYGIALITHNPDDFHQIPDLQIITEKQ